MDFRGRGREEPMDTTKTRMLVSGAMAALAVAACSASDGSGATNIATTSSEARVTPVVSESVSPYAYFVATRQAGQIEIAAINGASFSCGGAAPVTSCQVASIDLSALNLTAATQLKILAQVGRDATSPTILFAGSVANDSLAVQEVWRAPAALPIDGTMLFYSQALPSALVVDQWTPVPVGTLDFAAAPQATFCDNEDGGIACAPSYLPVEEDVASPTGILMLGTTRGGITRVSQYFLQVTFGHDQDDDGYSYCQAGQTLCGNGMCSSSGICLHWGGRGLLKIYTGSTDPTFDQWLPSTGQATTDPSTP